MNLNELKKYGNAMDRMYYFFLFIIVFYDCLVSTPIVSNLVIVLGNAVDGHISLNAFVLVFEIVVNLRLLIIIPALYRVLVCMKSNKVKLLSVLSILVGWLSSYHLRYWNDYSILIITLLIIASYGRDFRMIARYSGFAIITTVMIAAVLCILGVLPDYVLERNGRIRHSFGMIGPTAIAGHMSAVILALFICRNGALNWFEHVLVAVLFVLNAFFVDGRTVSLTVMLVYIGSIVYLIVKKKRLSCRRR